MKDTLTPKKLVKVKIDKIFERDFGNTNLKIWRVHNDKELVEKTFEKLKEKISISYEELAFEIIKEFFDENK